MQKVSSDINTDKSEAYASNTENTSDKATCSHSQLNTEHFLKQTP